MKPTHVSSAVYGDRLCAAATAVAFLAAVVSSLIAFLAVLDRTSLATPYVTIAACCCAWFAVLLREG